MIEAQEELVMVEAAPNMGSRTRRLTLELLKAALMLGIFVLLQAQISSVQREIDGGAVARAENSALPVERALLDSIEITREDLVQARRELVDSLEFIERDRESLTSLLADQGHALRESFGLELASHRGHLDEALELLQRNERRLHGVESLLSQVETSSPSELERSMLYPIVQLKGNKTVGSGVIIASRRVDGDGEAGDGDADEVETFAVTAYHVVKEILADEFPLGVLEKVRILEDSRGQVMKTCSAVVEIFDADLDLALLRLRLDAPFPHVARPLDPGRVEDLNLFTRVYAVGCPLGNKPIPTYGEISSKSKRVGDQVFWMVTAPTFFGNSGGGIFSASDGRLIGISSMIYTYTYGMNRSMVVPHMGLFVPITTVSEWLESENLGHLLDGGEERGAPADESDREAVAVPAAAPGD